MYVYIYIYVHIHVSTHTRNIHVYIYIYIHICIYIHIYNYTHIYIYIYMCIYIYTDVITCMYECMNVYTCGFCEEGWTQTLAVSVSVAPSSWPFLSVPLVELQLQPLLVLSLPEPVGQGQMGQVQGQVGQVPSLACGPSAVPSPPCSMQAPQGFRIGCALVSTMQLTLA